MQNDKEKFKKEFKDRLYKFVLGLIKFIGKLNLKDQVSRVIADQLARSGCSILSNYIEGQSASSKREFTLFFERSLKSANESKAWIIILRDSGKSDVVEANELLNELEEISNIFDV